MDSRTESATPKKRQDERKKGNTFSSKDVVALVTTLAVFSVLRVYFPVIVENMYGVFYKFVGYASAQSVITTGFAMQILRDSIFVIVVTVLPVMLVSMVSSIVATGAQTRFLFSTEALRPKFSRMNPINGFKNLFSVKSLVEVIKAMIKIIIIISIVYDFFIEKLPDLSKTLSLDISQSVAMMLVSAVDLVYNICIIFSFIAALDFLYQWWDYERQLRMTKQEVKEEYKQMEGDPKVKGKIKETQRKFAMSRMMQAVPAADVIIRNPTHYAVALKYDIDRDEAPTVIAKGQDELALRIVRIGQENDIVIMESPELTRAIYAVTDINQMISPDYYQAVAEVLAYVYSIKNKQI